MRIAFTPLRVLGSILLLGMLLSCGAPQPSVEWPATPAGRWLRDFVSALNLDDESALREFVFEHYSPAYLAEHPVEDMVAQWLSGRPRVGHIDVHSVTASGDYSATMVARYAGFGAFFELTLELDPEPPHDFKSLREEPVASPEPAPPLAIGEWDSLPELLAAVRDASGAPALAAALVRGDRVVDSAIVGTRRSGFDEPAQIDDRFHLGSVTKSFTATLVARLVEQGRLDWDLTIGDVFADLPVRDVYKPVTLEQLLQHRGGLPRMASGGEFSKASQDMPARTPPEGRLALTRQVLQEEPIAEPGTGSHYSNAGYAVVGVMIERVIGSDWEGLMREQVFVPLALASARFGQPATLAHPDQPWGHLGAPPDLRAREPGAFFGLDLTTYLAPAGDVNCDIEDFARYALAHLRGLRGEDGVLRSASVARLHTPLALDEDGGGYASGWGITRTEDGSPEHWHNGSDSSFFSVVSIYPDDDMAIVVLTNYGLAAEAPLYQMMEEIRQRELAAAP